MPQLRRGGDYEAKKMQQQKTLELWKILYKIIPDFFPCHVVCTSPNGFALLLLVE